MRVALTTLGCKVNQYDSAVFERLFAEQGWRRVSFEQEADAYVINSCTVTDRADADARRLARRARRRNPSARVVMTGCYAQTRPGEVADLGEVDSVVGLGRPSDLIEAVRGTLTGVTAVSDLRRAETVETTGIVGFSGRARAFVKVQEGCNLFCTFCIIPLARGRSRSVPVADVLEEIEGLRERGFHEVVLTGVHLGGYGLDLPPPADLAGLLEAISRQRPGLRVRISSIDPPEIDDRLLDVVAGDPMFCRHFHVPLQAGHDDVLVRMRRAYARERAANALHLLRERIPGVCIGTDLITGFPGESEREFSEGMRFLADLPLDYLHVFPYSRRSATSAAKRWPELPDHVVHERARTMRKLDRRLRSRFLERNLGTRAEVLFENRRSDGRLHGYTDNYVPVVCEAEDRLEGSLVPVTLTARDGSRLCAHPLP